MTTRVSIDDIDFAIEWLRHGYEGSGEDDPNLESAKRMADWLQAERDKRVTDAAVRKVAAEKGVTPAAVRRALKAKREAPVVFKDRALQQTYEVCRRLGADTTSEFYHEGRPHRGAGHRCAYWDGRSGVVDSMYARGKGTPGYAAYRAGADDRKADLAKGHILPRAEFRGNSLVFPVWQPAGSPLNVG